MPYEDGFGELEFALERLEKANDVLQDEGDIMFSVIEELEAALKAAPVSRALHPGAYAQKEFALKFCSESMAGIRRD
jgi:hypothetical protein